MSKFIVSVLLVVVSLFVVACQDKKAPTGGGSGTPVAVPPADVTVVGDATATVDVVAPPAAPPAEAVPPLPEKEEQCLPEPTATPTPAADVATPPKTETTPDVTPVTTPATAPAVVPAPAAPTVVSPPVAAPHAETKKSEVHPAKDAPHPTKDAKPPTSGLPKDSK